jgi:hypothetical protein
MQISLDKGKLTPSELEEVLRLLDLIDIKNREPFIISNDAGYLDIGTHGYWRNSVNMFPVVDIDTTRNAIMLRVMGVDK